MLARSPVLALGPLSRPGVKLCGPLPRPPAPPPRPLPPTSFYPHQGPTLAPAWWRGRIARDLRPDPPVSGALASVSPGRARDAGCTRENRLQADRKCCRMGAACGSKPKAPPVPPTRTGTSTFASHQKPPKDPRGQRSGGLLTLDTRLRGWQQATTKHIMRAAANTPGAPAVLTGLRSSGCTSPT
ncbi:synaptic defective enhancer 1-like isoform X3 [Vulpes lagopus]|uniref:synaptic defective enhancer 1-like isoform X3 n=1 Tax=Vulpes lagopus TaxID=494514 RepID=UPI001BC90D0E|nr:synaptic defective enhancer 1-like isoform X3 [Vulpes lagopus]